MISTRMAHHCEIKYILSSFFIPRIGSTAYCMTHQETSRNRQPANSIIIRSVINNYKLKLVDLNIGLASYLH